MVRLETDNWQWYKLVNTEDEDQVISIQTDWDYPATASLFGWEPCSQCRETDGTVDCEHREASEMIHDAITYLDDHIGEVAQDPGYFN